MLSFSEFVQSRKTAGGHHGAREQMQSSRSAGHVASHPLLQQLDELKLQRTNTLSSKQQPTQHVTGAGVSCAIETAYIGTDTLLFGPMQQPLVSVAARAADGTDAVRAAATVHQQQHSATNSSSTVQQLQDQLFSRSQSRKLVRQHTTTTITSVASSTAPSCTVSSSHSLKQLPVSGQANGSSGAVHRAPRAVGSASQLPNSSLVGGSLLQPLSMTDALPSTKSSRSLASISVSTHTAAVRGSYTSPPTPLGRPYAGRTGCAQGQPKAVPATSHKHESQAASKQQFISKQNSSLSVVSDTKLSHAIEEQQDDWQLCCQQEPTDLQPATGNKAAAIRALQQQQELLQQTLKSYSLKRMQQQLVLAPDGQPDPHDELWTINSTASGGCGDADVQVPNQQVTVSAEASAPTSSSKHMDQHTDLNTIDSVAGKMKAPLNDDLTSDTCRKQIPPVMRMPVEEVAGAATGATADLISRDPSASSVVGTLLSPETTESSKDCFSTPANNHTVSQHQAVEGVLCTSSDVSDNSLCAALHGAPASDDHKDGKLQKQGRDVYSAGYLNRLRSSRSSGSKHSSKSTGQPCISESLGMLTTAGMVKQPVQGRIGEDLSGSSDSHVLMAARQHAKQLQQQNDALVRVLERERQQQEKTRQQVCEAQLELKESRAEWEVALQVLRQDKVALTAQLRRVMAGSEHQEVLDAYDTALAAAAFKVEEAQLAAAALAAQLTETELQLSQLQHICNEWTLTGGKCAFEEEHMASSSSDSAVAAVAVAAAGCRAGASGRSPQAALGADANCTRGLRALRQHQKHLEQQVLQQQQELSKLHRDNIKLIRFQKQYTLAVNKLQAATTAHATATVAAEEAGLRAAAANGRAERLQQEVEQLSQENQQLKSAEQQIREQLLQLQQSQQGLGMTAALQQASPINRGPAGVQLPIHQQRLVEVDKKEHQSPAAALPGRQTEPRTEGSPATSSSTSSSPSVHCSQSMSVITAAVKQHKVGAAKTTHHDKHSMSASSRQGAVASTDAMLIAQQVANALPSESPEQQQLASLMSAIAQGVQERKALTEQGQILLKMVMGSV